MRVYFSHGKESGPWGFKIKRLASIAEAAGLDVTSVDYRDLNDAEKRVERLLDVISNDNDDYILAGSSWGGYVSLVAAASCRPKAIFLMAPAIHMPGLKHQQYPTSCRNIHIIHGWDDEIIPVDCSIRYAREANVNCHLIDGDHGLNAVIENVAMHFELFLNSISR